MNKIILCGTIAKRISCYQSNDRNHGDFILAVKRKNKIDLIKCIAYGRVAKSMVRKCCPGDMILVTGQLKITRAKKTVVIVDSFDCIGFTVIPKRY